MHRNTYLLVLFLAVFATLIVGVNLGRGLAGKQTEVPKITPKPMPTVPAVPTITLNTYTNTVCGFSLQYPNTLTKLETATGSALLVDTTTKAQSLAIACQKEIPRPPIPADKIETRQLANSANTASISARLYHDASAKDGTPMDSLIFRVPKSGLDAFIAGYGETYDQILTTVKLIP
jgi:hypothetical protein